MQPPPPQLLTELYQNLPFLVAFLSTDGVVLHCNRETLRMTGYAESELLGHNFWGTLFPGNLFAQVPRFISPLAVPASPLLRDVPLMIRTRQGAQRTIAFTRFLHASPGGGELEGVRVWVCIGVDLTDRLLEADKRDQSRGGSQEVAAEIEAALDPFGAHADTGCDIEGEIITPLAISPPLPQHPSAGAGDEKASGERDPIEEAIRQSHALLLEIEEKWGRVETTFEKREKKTLETLAEAVESPAFSAALVDYGIRAERLHHAAINAAFEPLNALIDEMRVLYHAEKQ